MTHLRPPIPKSLDDIDPAWLTSALQTQWPDISVVRIAVERLVHGAATKARLRLTLGSPVPAIIPVVWVKAGWEEHSEWIGSALRLYAREAWFYRDLNPMLNMNVPRAYYADYSDGWQAILILEDLISRGATLTNATESGSFETVRRTLGELAKLHARFWNDQALDNPKLDVPMRPEDDSSAWMKGNGPDVIAKYLASERCAKIPDRIRDPKKIDKAFWVHLNHLLNDKPFSLLHGDAHPANHFVDADGSPGFFDWQTIAKGPWAYDVSYHMVSALSVADRRTHEMELLRYYLDQLNRFGAVGRPGFDEAWLQYRRYIAYGLHIWITTPPNFQPDPICAEMSLRFATAADDFDFFRLWDV